MDNEAVGVVSLVKRDFSEGCYTDALVKDIYAVSQLLEKFSASISSKRARML